MDKLTRGEAHELVDAAYQMCGLPHLAATWIGHADSVDADTCSLLHEYVNACAEQLRDGRGGRNPSDSDDTGLCDVDFDAVRS